ncbi:DUF2653 family protein [Aneurinibacillus tyrosinisolvens]|uniref:DUF2653 family protein n=1 Tax=Aneurinibacillus tyrosinisolvens TaxID=1443435 RepID=UPI00063F0532|nr:DUF2653 family protein [Aneurinibacillus tyrosinisolvens]
MKLYFSEQDVIDSCCVFAARQHHCSPQDIDVDLQFNPARGFSAEVKKGWQHSHLYEQELIDSIALYLSEYHNFVPDGLLIDLVFSEADGIGALVDAG